jgi:hypothetical protein
MIALTAVTCVFDVNFWYINHAVCPLWRNDKKKLVFLIQGRTIAHAAAREADGHVQTYSNTTV